MTRASLLPLALFGCLAGSWVNSAAQSKTPVEYRITGTLVSSADGSPIAHGHLVPTLVDRESSARRRFPAPGAAFDTDEHGRLSIVLPSAGLWNLTASARGFARQAYLGHEEFSSGVVLTKTAPAIELRFVLSPESDITGVVVDEAGEPVRHAQVSLVAVNPPGPDRGEPASITRQGAQTDDRGVYEFAGLPAGSYQLCVQAQPWYAVAAGSQRMVTSSGARAGANGGGVPDPSLDVTYPLTWFPGVADQKLAETLTVNAGDTRQADFHLLPIPSIHLLINPPRGADGGVVGRGIPMMPLIQRVGIGSGGQPFVPVTFQRNDEGQLEVSGLSPGLYQVRVGGPGQEPRSSVVKVNAGSVETLDMGAASDEAHVTVRFDGLHEDEGGAVEVNLLDPDTRRSVFPSNRYFNGGGARLQRRDATGDRTFDVPPGRYEVVLQGRPEIYLTGISAQGAESHGRIVTVPAGDSSLTLHVANGRVTLNGIASFNGKPSVGAMVLLVPTTLGDPGAIAILRRDQSNTDGSFDLRDVIPGQYILIAIDDGWKVNWNDASTLRGYLMQGVPLDLSGGGSVKENIVAQAP